jgi:hypothetical protein
MDRTSDPAAACGLEHDGFVSLPAGKSRLDLPALIQVK